MRSVLLVLLFLFGATEARAQQRAPASGSDVSDLVDAYEDVYGFSGVVLVAAGDSIRYEGARGPAERGFDVPNRPELRFPINSISKTFAAAAALTLVADGRLDLHAPLSTHLPDLEAEWADRLTAHHLLSHTSGLPREFEVAAWEKPSLVEQARRVGRLPLDFEPGARYGYSNAGYALLGRLIEHVAGVPYPTFLRSSVLDPANLDDTGMLAGRAVIENLARPYAMSPAGVVEAPRGKHLSVNAGGGLYATAGDLYEWVRALENGSVLLDSLQDLLFTPHAEEGGPDDLAGYGWALKRYGENTFRMAAGSGNGTKSAILRDPNTGLFIAVLSNWADVPVLDLLRDLLFASVGRSYELPSAAGLADAASYDEVLGTYAFEPDVLGTALGLEADVITLLGDEGRVYLTAPDASAELLRATDDDGLALTYTDELSITFERDADGTARAAIIRINGRELRGSRVTPTKNRAR
jgi:CubicO group peptidase (beta-lactamase class C family)